MADKRKRGRRKDDIPLDKDDKPSKTEDRVAKYLKKNLPGKKTKFLQHTVEYFTASKAINALLDSDWATGKHKTDVIFTNRESVVDFMNVMLRHKYFHRARKVRVSDKDLQGKALKKFKEQEKKKEEEKKKKSKDTDKDDDEGDSKDDDEKGSEKDEKKNGEDKNKKKTKIKLDMHLDQVFVDGNDAYVWLYDPVPLYYWFVGGLVVIGTIAICLFPLWPPIVRLGVYYLSMTAAGFLVCIIALAIIRVILFFLIWIVTFGNHHLWIFPNLTEDVGFFASFWPLYKYEYKGPEIKKRKKKKPVEESKPEETKKLLPDVNKGNSDVLEEDATKTGSDSGSESPSDSDMPVLEDTAIGTASFEILNDDNIKS